MFFFCSLSLVFLSYNLPSFVVNFKRFFQVRGTLSLSPEQVVFVKNAALNGTCAPVINVRV